MFVLVFNSSLTIFLENLQRVVSPVHRWWESVSDWTAPSACRHLCADRSYSQWAGCVCSDRNPGSQFSTVDKTRQCCSMLTQQWAQFEEIAGIRWVRKEKYDYKVKYWSHYLFQTAVHSVWTADVKTQQNCIWVTVAQGPHIIIVWRALEDRNKRVINVDRIQGNPMLAPQIYPIHFSCLQTSSFLSYPHFQRNLAPNPNPRHQYEILYILHMFLC